MVQKCLLKVENQFTDDEDNLGGYSGSLNLGLKNRVTWGIKGQNSWGIKGQNYFNFTTIPSKT